MRFFLLDIPFYPGVIYSRRSMAREVSTMWIREYLESRKVWYETLLHPPVPSATKLAQSVHVPGRCVAKVVLVKAGEAFVLAVLPATHRIDLARLGQVVGGDGVRLATEEEAEAIFKDCER